MGDYEKKLDREDLAAVARLLIFHPDLLNPKYFETYDPQKEDADSGCIAVFIDDPDPAYGDL